MNQWQQRILKRYGRHSKACRKCLIVRLAQNVKKEAMKAGFKTVGISDLDGLRDLPYGKIDYVGVLKTPEQELPRVKSVMLMTIHAWDKAFNIVVDSSELHFNKKNKPKVSLENHQLHCEIAIRKAWVVAHYLQKRGFDSVPSVGIPMKTAAVKCGLGCQGKSTLLVTPDYGRRVRLVSVLTTAELDIDEP
jgi:epoxyqueuosine reductase QueG